MATEPEGTLADRWITRLKNHSWVAAILVTSAIVVGAASFTDSARKLLEAAGFIPPKSPTPIVVQFPAGQTQPAADAPPRQQSDCVSDRDALLYEAELKNVDLLIQQGEALLRSADLAAVKYEMIKVWEDTVSSELRAYDKNHQNNTAFEFEFQHWRTQYRGTGFGQNAQLVSIQQERNLAVLRKLKMHSTKVVAEAGARRCRT